MSLAGTGAICIWNDITSAGRDEFYAWHLREHIPERVAIPGFLSGRRYIACEAATTPEFFTYYQTITAAVLTGADYLARLNAPTAWTKTATQAFRNTSRALTSVTQSHGVGTGGILATVRLAAPDAATRAAITQFGSDTLATVARLPQINGAHLCLTDIASSAARTAESLERTDIMAAPDGVILIEGCTVGPVTTAAHSIQQALQTFTSAPPLIGLYRLEHLHAAT